MKSRLFANLVLISAALLSSFGAIVVSPLFDPRPGTASRQWLFSSVLLVVAAIFLLGLRLPLSGRISLAMTLLSLGVGLYAMEGVLRWQNASRVRNAARRLGNPYDPRLRLEVLLDFRRSGVDAWPAVFPGSLLGKDGSQALLPLGGISQVTTVHCNEVGPYLIYRSDEHGFHNPPGIWGNPTLDVALLGDSFAHGNCVGSDQNAAARIRAVFPATLNLGIGGNGPMRELAGIKEYLPELRPRNVVWIFCAANDLLFDLPVEKKVPILRHYLDPGFSQQLQGRQAEVDAFLKKDVSVIIDEQILLQRKSEAKWNFLEGLVRLRMLRHRAGIWLDARKPPAAPDFELLRRVLLEARDTVSGWGGRFFLVYLPSQEVLLDPDFARDNEPERREILEILQEARIPVIDFQATLQEQEDPAALYASPGAHFNPRGYQLLGKTIVDALRAGAH